MVKTNTHIYRSLNSLSELQNIDLLHLKSIVSYQLGLRYHSFVNMMQGQYQVITKPKL